MKHHPAWMLPTAPARLWRVGAVSFCCLGASLLAGCWPSGPSVPLRVFGDAQPARITDLALECDVDAGRWRLDVSTTGWASGGALLWTLDGNYAERHQGLRSVRAAADGSTDQLRLDLPVVEDFRGAGNGATRFGCASRPNGLIWVLDLDGRRTDCRVFGPFPVRAWSLPDTPACPDPWVFDEGDGGDTDVDTGAAD